MPKAPPAPSPPPSPPSRPEPPAETTAEFDTAPIWEQFVTPEESGLPPSEAEPDPYMDMLRDMGYGQDPFAADALWYGWFDESISSDQRVEARQMFFDYTGLGREDFDWDQWREWYGETAA